MLSRERQAARAARRIYRSGARTPEAILRATVGELLEMGGLYVKFAQLLLLNQVFSKVVPLEIRREIFDRVKVDEAAGLAYFLPESERQAMAKDVTLISDKPLFAGSFAAVFEGRLAGSEEVVVKVLRPELRKTLKQDLRLLALIMRPMKMLGPEIRIAIESIMANFRKAILEETDYILEVRNAQILAEAFKDSPAIYIPKTYAELSNATKIVQEKISGVWLSEVLSRAQQGISAEAFVLERIGSDLENQLFQLGKASLTNTLEERYIHGDTHPGNIVLLPGDRVGLIDFGVIAPPINNRLAMLEYLKIQVEIHQGNLDIAKLLLAVLRFHTNRLYRAIMTLSEVLKMPLLDRLYDVVKTEIDESQIDTTKQRFAAGDYSRALNETINQNNRFGLQPQWDQPLTQKALISLWRTNEELDFQSLNTKIFSSVIGYIEARNDTSAWQEERMSEDAAFEVIGEWLFTIAEKDPDLFKRIRKLIKDDGRSDKG